MERDGRMKTITKFKILRFVERLLRLPDPDPRHLNLYTIQERNIQRLQSEHILNEVEMDFLKDKEEAFMKHLKQEMAINVAKVMQQIGAIRYEINTDFSSGNVKITATTYVPEKL